MAELEEIVGPIAVGYLFSLGTPLFLEYHDLTEKYGFNDGDLFFEYAKQIAKQPIATGKGGDERGNLSHWILMHLVAELLVRPAYEEGLVLNVTFMDTGHNPARLHSVNGLLGMEPPAGLGRAEITPEALIQATLAALRGDERWTPAPAPGLDSAVDGLKGLLGRSVEVDVGLEESVVGHLAGVGGDFLTLFSARFDGEITVIPMSSVKRVSSSQFSEVDDQRFGELLLG